MTSYTLHLREVDADDLAIFFEQQLDADANFMAAFTAKNPTDHDAFLTHWRRIAADSTVQIRTVIVHEESGSAEVAGYVLSYEEDGRPEISYWLGRGHWGRGIATRALAAFLADVERRRPIFARVAADNLASRRVLEKCGFTRIGDYRGFANARNAEIDELLLELSAS